MSDLFETQDEVSQLDCIKYAQTLVGTSVKPVPSTVRTDCSLRVTLGAILINNESEHAVVQLRFGKLKSKHNAWLR